MARPREFDEEDVLDAAKRVFWAKGYEGASITDLVGATGLRAGSLYNAFGGKKDLYLATLNRYGQREIQGAADWLLGTAQSESAAQSIIGLFTMILDQIEAGDYKEGCFMCNAAVDQASADPDIAASVKNNMQPLHEAYKSVLSRDPGHQADADGLADHFLATHMGVFVLARANYGLSIIQNAVRHAFAVFPQESAGPSVTQASAA